MATDIPRIHKWWQQPSPNNDYRPNPNLRKKKAKKKTKWLDKQKPENVVNRPIDGQTDGQTDGQKSGRGTLLLGDIAMAPSTWFRRKMW